MVDAYIEHDMSLKDFPKLFIELQELSLCILVERKPESIHAPIKAETKASRGVLPGFTCAKIRASYTLSLHKDAATFGYICDTWAAKNIVRTLLEFDGRRLPIGMDLPKL